MFLCNYILCICIVQSRLEIVRIVYSSAIDSKRSVSCMFANVMCLNMANSTKFRTVEMRHLTLHAIRLMFW